MTDQLSGTSDGVKVPYQLRRWELGGTPDSAAPSAAGLSINPHRRVTDLLQRLSPGKMRIGFFIGAGAPWPFVLRMGKSTKPLIPDIAGSPLWFAPRLMRTVS